MYGELQRKPTARLVVQVGYSDVLTAVGSWQVEELEALIGDLQRLARQRKVQLEKHNLPVPNLPSQKVSMADMVSILPANIVAPPDEDVEEALMLSRLERLGDIA